MRSEIKIYNKDCLPAMKQMQNNEFDLAIVDPPYGIGNTTTSAGNKKRRTLHNRVKWNDKIPSQEYFNELLRISENQIIWGCNYFHPYINVPGRIVHYKKPFQNLEKGRIKFCPCDLASQSFDRRIEYFEYNWYGNTQGGIPNFKNTGMDVRIHPTQKPVALYKWLLSKYAKPGNKILDTHLGSGSIMIACWDLCFNLTAYETDKEYFDSAKKRFELYKKQLQIW